MDDDQEQQANETKQPSGSQAAGDGGEALRELALRLLAFRFGESGEAAARLIVGEMPPDLPVELPLPEVARVLGAFVQERPTIALDTELTGEAAMASYRERLVAQGWSEQEFPPHRQGGFVHTMPGNREHANFFSPDGQYMLSVMAAAAPGGAGRTTMQIVLHRQSPQEQQRPRMLGRDMWSVLPAIHAPRGASQQAEGGSGGPDRVSANARLETGLDLPSVVTHYTEELTRAGWERRDGGHAGPSAWSAWGFRDEEGAAWSALLFILRHPVRPGRYDLVLKAELDGGAGRANRSGYVTSSIQSSGPRLVGQQMHYSSAPLTSAGGPSVTEGPETKAEPEARDSPQKPSEMGK